MTLSIATLITMTHSIDLPRITTFCIMKHEKDTHHDVTQHNDTQNNGYIITTQHYIYVIPWIIFFLLCDRLSVTMLSVTMLIVTMLSVTMLSAIILNVSAPWGVTVAIDWKKRLKSLAMSKHKFNISSLPFTDTKRMQGILKGEASLYHWPPVWLVWNQLYCYWQFLFLFAKQTNPNLSNRRSTVQWYFPV
jgi:hypothetical protein